MDNHKTPTGAAASLIAMVIALAGAPSAFGTCRAPHYRRGPILVDKPSEVVLLISIRLVDFAPERLICLAGALRREFPGRNVTADIFSSHRSTLTYVPGDIDVPEAARDAQFRMHGFYMYNDGTHEEYVEILPEGDRYFDPLIITRIDLPVTGTWVCRAAMNGRCLLEFRHIYYPLAEGGPSPSGQVTLSGVIRRDGTMSRLAVADVNANPAGMRSFLADLAKTNLGTWHFEPGKSEEAVRITYVFEVSDVPIPGGEHTEFRLPNEVRVRTNGFR